MVAIVDVGLDDKVIDEIEIGESSWETTFITRPLLLYCNTQEAISKTAKRHQAYTSSGWASRLSDISVFGSVFQCSFAR